MKRIIAILGIIGLGIGGLRGGLQPAELRAYAGGCKRASTAREMQNNTGTNFLAHSFKAGFVDLNGNLVDSRDGRVRLPAFMAERNVGLLLGDGATSAAATTANAIGALDLGSPLIVGNTVATSATLSSVTASTPTLSNVGQTSATVTMTIRGTLKNNDGVTYAGANVCAVLFNTSGQVVLTQKQSLGDLATGATNNFTMSVTVPNSTASVSTVTVCADALENNVPTTPISSSAALNSGAAKVAFTTQPSTTAAGGTAFAVQPVVALQDSSGNTITSGAGSTSQVTLTLGGGATGAALTCAANPVTAVAGIAAFSGCKIDKASATAYTLTASSPGATSATSTGIVVSPGGAAKVGFTLIPTSAVASGANFNVTAAVQDLGGNTVTSATNTVAIAICAGLASRCSHMRPGVEQHGCSGWSRSVHELHARQGRRVHAAWEFDQPGRSPTGAERRIYDHGGDRDEARGDDRAAGQHRH